MGTTSRQLSEVQRLLLLELNGHPVESWWRLSELSASMEVDGLTLKDAAGSLWYRDLLDRETISASIFSHDGKRGSNDDPLYHLTWLGRQLLESVLEAEARRAREAQERAAERREAPAWLSRKAAEFRALPAFWRLVGQLAVAGWALLIALAVATWR